MAAYRSENTLIVCICNEYADDERNILTSVAEDIKYLQVLENHYRVKFANNLSESDLMSRLDDIAYTYEDRDDVDTVIVIYAGHGYYSDRNLFAGIYAKGMVKIGLAEILGKFKSFERLCCIFDACRVIRETGPVNYDTIENRIQVCLFGSEKEKGSRGQLVVAFIRKIIYLIEKLNTARMLAITKEVMIEYLHIQEVERRRSPDKINIPKFYVNSNVRIAYPDEVSELQEMTEQSDRSIQMTRVNRRAENAMLKRQMKEKFVRIYDRNRREAESLKEEYENAKREYKDAENRYDARTRYRDRETDSQNEKWLRERRERLRKIAISKAEKYIALREELDRDRETYERYKRDLGRS